MVATALSMALMYLVLAAMFLARAGRAEAFDTFPDGTTGVGNYLMQSLTQRLQFGVAVILFGVRTILGELVPTFQSIAAKVVPGATPTLDTPHHVPLHPKNRAGGLHRLLLRRTDRPGRTLRVAPPRVRRRADPPQAGATLLHQRRGGARCSGPSPTGSSSPSCRPSWWACSARSGTRISAGSGCS
ncbi:hypothetical protein J2S56_000222 [Corynebacterium lowii]|nr:hypothetical protein [Corynebacterium lowii]